MNFVEALSLAHQNGIGIKLPDWGGWWHFAADGKLINSDGTSVEPSRISNYALRDDWEVSYTSHVERNIRFNFKELEDAAKPLVEYLKKYHNMMCQAIVTIDSVRITEDVIKTYIK